MTRFRLVCRAIAVAAVAMLFAAGDARASHPDILRNYRIIPRHSTLEVTGGFAGVDLTYDLRGRFGLVTGYEGGVSCLAIGCPPPPTHIPFAKFVNVDVRAMLDHPAVDAFPVPLERFVDLEQLRGTFHDPNFLSFSGKDNQGAPFKLRAKIHGRLIRLVGANDPPCCDFFNYRIDAYAHLAPFGDFNFDGKVDMADYTKWRDHLGMTSDATLEHGDADGDGDVDHEDYAIWKHDFGTTLDMAAFADVGDGVAALAAVPEPSALGLLAWCALMFAPLVRRIS